VSENACGNAPFVCFSSCSGGGSIEQLRATNPQSSISTAVLQGRTAQSKQRKQNGPIHNNSCQMRQHCSKPGVFSSARAQPQQMLRSLAAPSRLRSIKHLTMIRSAAQAASTSTKHTLEVRFATCAALLLCSARRPHTTRHVSRRSAKPQRCPHGIHSLRRVPSITAAALHVQLSHPHHHPTRPIAAPPQNKTLTTTGPPL